MNNPHVIKLINDIGKIMDGMEDTIFNSNLYITNDIEEIKAEMKCIKFNVGLLTTDLNTRITALSKVIASMEINNSQEEVG